MESIRTMAEFTEVLMHDPNHAYDFISNNYYRLDKTELVSIVKELLYGIYQDCCPSQMNRMLSNVAIELDEQYDEQYQEIQ